MLRNQVSSKTYSSQEPISIKISIIWFQIPFTSFWLLTLVYYTKLLKRSKHLFETKELFLYLQCSRVNAESRENAEEEATRRFGGLRAETETDRVLKTLQSMTRHLSK